jgi:hypothetical protein
MDLHYLLAPLVRQAIQFPLPAPELAGAGRFFLVPYTAKAPCAAGTCGAGRKLGSSKSVEQKTSSAASAGSGEPEPARAV